jgi:outer membrane protein
MKCRFALYLTLALGLALSATAQTPSVSIPAGHVKIAIIAFQAAVGQTNEFQRNFADLQKKYEPKLQQIKALGEEIDTLTKQLQAQGGKLSAAERAQRATTIDDKKKQAQRELDDSKTDFQQEFQNMFGSTASKVGEVLVAYARQQGYTLVLDRSEKQQQSPAVLYANPSTDITKAVIDAYNLKSGVPAPPVQPAAAMHKPAAKPPVTH